MSRFNFDLDAPSGSLVRDLESGKRVELRRGQNTRVEKVGSDERVIRFVCSTDGVKRDGNRLRNNGWDLESFSKNPVMLWSHDYSQPPVGSWQDYKVVKDGEESSLVMTAKFADYDFADTVYKLYIDGHMRAVSIGWTPLEYDKIEDEDGNFVGFDFLKNELLECSAVPIPADPDALMQATARGLITGDEMQRFAQATRVGDISRGEAYVLDHRGLRQEERVAIVFNDKAVGWANGAIEKGDYESSQEWTWSEEDATLLLDGPHPSTYEGEDEGEVEGENWAGYAFHFLGRDEDHTEDSYEGWTFPIAKRREDGVIALYASALELAIETSEDEAITAAAAEILSTLRARDEEQDEEGSEEEVEEEVEVEVVEEPDLVVEASAQREVGSDLNQMYDSLVAHVKGANLPLMELWKSIKAHGEGEDFSMRVAEDAHRVATLLSAGIDIAAEIADTVGGHSEGEDTGGDSSEETTVEVVEASADDDTFEAGLARLLEAMDDWSPSSRTGSGDQGATDDSLSEADIESLVRALGHADASDWDDSVSRDESEDGEARIGKKVSRKRTEKIAEASRSVMDAYRMLEEVLEDIDGGELLTEEEVTDAMEEGTDVDAPVKGDTEDSRKSEAPLVRKVKRSEDKLPKEESPTLEQRIADLARSFDSEDDAKAQAKIDKALRALADKLNVDIDSTYVDEIL